MEHQISTIDTASAAALAQWLAEQQGKAVIIRLISPGGDALAGLSMSNSVAKHGNCTVIADGQCASAATLILAAAKTARAVSTAQLMVHPPHAQAGGQADDFAAMAAALENTAIAMKEVYSKRIAAETLEGLMTGSDAWMTAEQAKSIGLVDDVVAHGSPAATGNGIGTPQPDLPNGGFGGVNAPSRVTVTDSQRQLRFRAASDSILARAGLMDAPAPGSNPFMGLTLRQMADGSGIQAVFPDGIDAFPGILADSANRAMGAAFEAAPEVWTSLCERMPVPDFRETSVGSLGLFDSAPEIREFSELKFQHLADTAEKGALKTHGFLFGLSRRSIVNDDTGAFARIAGNMAEACSRAVGDQLAAWVTTGATGRALADGDEIFHADRGNTGAAAMSSASLAAGFTKLATMEDPNGIVTGQRPNALWVPWALYPNSQSIMAAEFDLGSDFSVAQSGAPNRARGLVPMEGIYADWRLDKASLTKWYLLGPRQFVVLLLMGNETPMVDQRSLDTRDGFAWKIVFDALVLPTGHYRIYRGGN